MTQLRCAAYARYSTDRQNPLSIDDQIRKCHEFAQHQCWEFLSQNVYSDEAISGATDERSGLKRLIADAISPAHPFDVILVDDTSRLSRKLGDSLRIFEQLHFAGVRVVFVSQGIDTKSEQAEVLLATHGIVDSLYIRELSKKVYRGVEGRALKGMHPGGRCFGYRSQPIEDPGRTDPYGRPVITGVKLVVNEPEAETVRRVFSLYAKGLSFERIAKLLNSEGVPSPRPQRAHPAKPWGTSTIQKILHNDRYRGQLIWNKTRKLRSPHTGRRIYRHRASTEWVMIEAPEQRIISDELWNSVHDRIGLVKQLYGTLGRKEGLLRAHAVNSPYLFSGLLKCAVCGSNMTIVSGRGKENPGARYGCPRNALQGVCPNSVRVRRTSLERALLDKLQRDVLRPEVIEYTLGRFEQQLMAALEGLSGELDKMRRRKADLEAKIQHHVHAIENSGYSSPSVMSRIAVLEKERDEISNRLLESRPDSVHERLHDIRQFVTSRLVDLARLLNADSPTVRTEIAKHIQSISLESSGESCQIVGSWDLLGSVRVVAASEREARMDDAFRPHCAGIRTRTHGSANC